jgi:hypothetical protein
LGIMGVKHVGAGTFFIFSILNYLWCLLILLSILFKINKYFSFIGFTDARTCGSLPNDQITWCSRCSPVFGNAGRFPGFQRHKDTIICYR